MSFIPHDPARGYWNQGMATWDVMLQIPPGHVAEVCHPGRNCHTTHEHPGGDQIHTEPLPKGSFVVRIEPKEEFWVNSLA